MELARIARCVKAARPFESTIFSHVSLRQEATHSTAIRVPVGALLAMVRAAVRAAPPLAPDILAFQPGDGLLEAPRAVPVAGVVGGMAQSGIGDLLLQQDELLIFLLALFFFCCCSLLVSVTYCRFRRRRIAIEPHWVIWKVHFHVLRRCSSPQLHSLAMKRWRPGSSCQLMRKLPKVNYETSLEADASRQPRRPMLISQSLSLNQPEQRKHYSEKHSVGSSIPTWSTSTTEINPN